jgi:excinuclease ABC subunit C
VDTLRARMLDASEAERFEQAAALRDAMRTVETLRDRQQKMATAALDHRDAFGLKAGPEGTVVQVFQVRRGRVVERVELAAAAGDSEAEVIEAAVQQFYETRPAPAEVHLPVEVEHGDALEDWLSARAGRRVKVATPRRGAKRALVDLASRNAALAYQQRFSEAAAAGAQALEILRSALALPTLPRRIECFDISTIQGRDTVASMVVCEDGRMRRSDYRKYRINQLNNDFAAMQDVVGRRYRRLLEQGGPFPDLVIVDGGRGQLSSAYAALENLGLSNLVAAAIAKKEELLYLRDSPDPIALPTDSPALLLVQRIRDEAHRFAVTFHRRTRTRRDLGSELDEVPGIGARRRRALLTRFGSLAGVRRATREELLAVVGPKAADAVLAFFAARP